MHVMVIHSCRQTLERLRSLLQQTGLQCECHTSPVAAAYTFAFSNVQYVAVLAGREVGTLREGNVLQVIRSLQPSVNVQYVDTPEEALLAAREILGSSTESPPLQRFPEPHHAPGCMTHVDNTAPRHDS
ncbi:hypothetical protein [Megalodesulfovibrio paquesii]